MILNKICLKNIKMSLKIGDVVTYLSETWTVQSMKSLGISKSLVLSKGTKTLTELENERKFEKDSSNNTIIKRPIIISVYGHKMDSVTKVSN